MDQDDLRIGAPDDGKQRGLADDRGPELTKRECAMRLISAALRMNGEADKLATYVTASSALSLLRELCQAKGGPYAARMEQLTLFSAGSALAAGRGYQMPSPLFEQRVRAVADAIIEGSVQRPEDLRGGFTRDEERAMLAPVVRPFNFLKHADRDAEGTISAANTDPRPVISHALSAYIVLYDLADFSEDVIDLTIDHSMRAISGPARDETAAKLFQQAQAGGEQRP